MMRAPTSRLLHRLNTITRSCKFATTSTKMAEQTIPSSLRAIAGEVAGLLKQRKETISVAETAAGGLISAALLATPGASGIYKGGLTVSGPVGSLKVDI